MPFCKADPVAGAKVNVVGTVNAFEAARWWAEVARVRCSIAAHSFFPEAPWPATRRLPCCDEMIARTYAGDRCADIDPRPVVYGVGGTRD